MRAFVHLSKVWWVLGTNREKEKKSTHHHQNLLLKVPDYNQKKKIIRIISCTETPRASN
jgi:hypothetical protein